MFYVDFNCTALSLSSWIPSTRHHDVARYCLLYRRSAVAGLAGACYSIGKRVDSSWTRRRRMGCTHSALEASQEEARLKSFPHRRRRPLVGHGAANASPPVDPAAAPKPVTAKEGNAGPSYGDEVLCFNGATASQVLAARSGSTHAGSSACSDSWQWQSRAATEASGRTERLRTVAAAAHASKRPARDSTNTNVSHNLMDRANIAELRLKRLRARRGLGRPTAGHVDPSDLCADADSANPAGAALPDDAEAADPAQADDVVAADRAAFLTAASSEQSHDAADE
jgi:hypothetical protein